MSLALALWPCALLTACQPWLFVDDPIGDPVTEIDKAVWDGAWLIDGRIAWIKLIDDAKAVRLGTWENGESDCSRRTYNTWPMSQIRRFRDIELGEPNFKKEEGKYGYAYLSGTVRSPTGGISFTVSEDRVRSLVRTGELPGRVSDDGKVYLDKLSDAHIDALFKDVRRSSLSSYAKLPPLLDPCGSEDRAPTDRSD